MVQSMFKNKILAHLLLLKHCSSFFYLIVCKENEVEMSSNLALAVMSKPTSRNTYSSSYLNRK